MNVRSVSRLLSVALLGALAVPIFSGCDTTDPVPPVEPDEVAGIYDFTEFRFDPDRSGILPVDVLDTLVVEETRLDLRTDGRFQLFYKFEGDLSEVVNGTFEVTQNEVGLTARDSEVAQLNDLLLSQPVTFQRAGQATLVLDKEMTVDLAAYDEEQYGGTAPQPGTLQIQLVRRSD